MHKALGQRAYEAYCANTGGRSAVTGAPLPAWEVQREDIREAWAAVEKAILDFILSTPAPAISTLGKISIEVIRARAKFPSAVWSLAALTEEVGELAQAVLDRQFGKQLDRGRIEAEGIQVAAMAIRILEEGDPSFPASVPLQEVPCPL